MKGSVWYRPYDLADKQCLFQDCVCSPKLCSRDNLLGASYCLVSSLLVASSPFLCACILRFVTPRRIDKDHTRRTLRSQWNNSEYTNAHPVAAEWLWSLDKIYPYTLYAASAKLCLLPFVCLSTLIIFCLFRDKVYLDNLYVASAKLCSVPFVCVRPPFFAVSW